MSFCGQEKSFTLLELLVAVTITAIISGLVYGSLHGVMQSMKNARGKIELAQTARGIMWMIGDELGSAFINDTNSFTGTNVDDNEYDGDSVLFATTSGFAGTDGSGPTDVEYYSDRGMLFKSVGDGVWRVSKKAEVFELSYFDGKEWCENWNSAKKGKLPQTVRIDIKLDGEWFSTGFSPAVNKVYEQ